MKPTLPGRAMSAANVALNLFSGTITPRQFGPTMRMPGLGRSSKTWRSSSTAHRADFFEAGGNDDDAFHAHFAAIFDDARTVGGGVMIPRGRARWERR